MSRVTPYPLRINPGLRERLEAEAIANGRSYNAELALRLQTSIELQDMIGVDADQVKNVIDGLHNDANKAVKLDIENAELKLKLRELQSDIATSLAITGSDKSNLALMKLKKAYAHIHSGLDEIRNLIPEDK